MRIMRGRTWLGAVMVAGCLLVPASAFGAVREGTATDPAGDSAGAPSQDILGASARYDTNGALTVSATVNGEIATGPKSLFEFTLGATVLQSGCGGDMISLSGFSSGLASWIATEGDSNLSSGLISTSGNTITFYASGTQYANLAINCMQVTVSPTSGGAVLDRLNVPLAFGGSTSSGTTGAGSVNGVKPTGTGSAGHVAPAVLAFSSVASVKLSSGAGVLTARCAAPASENCTFNVTLLASVRSGRTTRHVTVGTVTGRIRGGSTGRLAIKLNAVGRSMLRHGTLHLEAKGTVRSDAGISLSFHRRITLKKR